MTGQPPARARFREVGDRVRNWSRWGPDDRVGTLNLLQETARSAAVDLMAAGRPHPLAIGLGRGSPRPEGPSRRTLPVHLMSQTATDYAHSPDGVGFADDYMFMPLQTGTHWDALAHCSYDGLMYNGVPADTVTPWAGAQTLDVSTLTAVSGRAVLLDVAGALGQSALTADQRVEPEHLERAERRQGVTVASGDILLIRTGWIRGHLDGTHAYMAGAEPGLTLACCEWLHARQVAALATDNYAVEHLPADPDDGAAFPVHAVLLRDMGMPLGENWNFEGLLRACEEDGRFDCFLTAPALPFDNAVGAPVAPLAFR